MNTKNQAVVLTEKDNVATALADLKSGSTIELDIGDRRITVALQADIPYGHKFSTAHIENGAPIIKYGEVIGTAGAEINTGDYVHVHNLASMRGSAGRDGDER